MPTWTFEGPVVEEIRPIVTSWPPTRLTVALLYGQTVWRDADGAWHQKFGPSFDELVGATAVYQGGRKYEGLDLEQALDLIEGGFGDYLTQFPPADDDGAVGTAIVGLAHVA